MSLSQKYLADGLSLTGMLDFLGGEQREAPGLGGINDRLGSVARM